MINVHATCVVLGRAGEPFDAPQDAGVLLIGESGAGKSDLALRLIACGAILIADDRCDLFVVGNELRARVPQPLRGLLEIRGLGIATLPFREEAAIRLAVRLGASAGTARLPEPGRYRPAVEIALPEHAWPREIAVAPGDPSAPAKIAAALAVGLKRIAAGSNG